MTSANNRRAVPGAVLAGATIGATALPALAAPAAPERSAVDPRVLDLWRRRAKVRAIVDRLLVQYDAADAQLPDVGDALGERCDAAVKAQCDLQYMSEKYIGASVLALGALLIEDISEGCEGEVDGVNMAALAAPQLVGAIAEAADRVLAQDEEDA